MRPLERGGAVGRRRRKAKRTMLVPPGRARLTGRQVPQGRAVPRAPQALQALQALQAPPGLGLRGVPAGREARGGGPLGR